MGGIGPFGRHWATRCALLVSALFAVLALAGGVAGAATAMRTHQAATNVNILGNWPGAAETPGGGNYPQVLVWTSESAGGAITGYETLIGSTAQTGTLAGTISGDKMNFLYTLGSYTSRAIATVSTASPPVISGTFADSNGTIGTETFTRSGAASAASSTSSTPATPSTPATVSAPVLVPSTPPTQPGSTPGLGITLGAVAHHDPARSTITSSLPSPRTAFSPVSSDVVNAIITIGAALLITFPASLFNATFQENYTEIRAATFRRLRALRLMPPEVVPGGSDAAAVITPEVQTPAAPGRPAPRPRKKVTPPVAAAATVPPVVMSAAVPAAPVPEPADKPGLHPGRTFLIVLLVGALIGCFNDPNFGFTGHSVLTFVGVILSEIVGMTIPALVAAAYHRGRHGSVPAGLHALPGGLLIALTCVVLSRLVGFQPGYLYGIVVGVSFNRELPKNEKGHVIALSTAAVLVASVAAWFLWDPINHAAAHHGAFVGTILFDNLLGAMFVSGLVGSVLSMVPLTFMPGSTLREWRQAVWAAVFLVSLFLLIQVLLRPRGGHGGHAPLVATLVLFVVFAVGSIAFHDYWARRAHTIRGEPIPALPERLKGLWKTPSPAADAG